MMGAPLEEDWLFRRTGIGPEELDFLGQVPLFAGLTRAQLALLMSDASVRRYGGGTTLFYQEEAAKSLFVIFEGWVKVFRQTPGGREIVIAVLTRGEPFGETTIFDPEASPLGAFAVTDARLLVVPGERFIAHIRDNSDLALRLLAAMSAHQHRLVQQVEQLTVRSTSERLAGFLCRLCPETTGAAEIDLPFDKSLIASRLGMQPESLSRALARLRAHGVAARGSAIMIADVAALLRFSEGDVGKGA